MILIFNFKVRVPILLLFFCLLYSCSSQTKEEETSPLISADPVETIVAIGKVVPEKGWIFVASETEGVVSEILIQEGDSVQAFQPLIRLYSTELPNDLHIAQLEEKKAAHTIESQHQELIKEKEKLLDLQNTLRISEELHRKNAETLEKLERDRSSVSQQRKYILSLEQKLLEAGLTKKIQTEKVEKLQQQFQSLSVVSSHAGVVTAVEATVGQPISTGQQLITLVDPDRILVEAEVDELFSDSVKISQRVSFYERGNPNPLGHGKILQTSPTLMNKSIMYETANEGEDRRVRRLKISIDSTLKLRINSKVECRIKL